MSSPELPGMLTRLEQSLEGLLSCFEGRRMPEQSEMESAWTRVQGSFDEVGAQLEHDGRARDELRERVDRCLRLYAVAAGILVQRRDELAAERAGVADARRRLRGARGEAAGGGACDVRA